MKFLFAHFSLSLFLALGPLSALAEENSVQLEFDDLTAEVTWLKGPRAPEESALRLLWRTRDNSPAEPGKFRVVLFMPDMGHGSSPTRIERELGPNGSPLFGVYRVSQIYFTMGGEWEVRVSISDGEGRWQTRAFSVYIPEHQFTDFFTGAIGAE